MSEDSKTNPNHFIRQIILDDLASGKQGKHVATRFPPEPNGYLHIGHAKSICLNFGIADEFGGTCNLRFDDTNPTKEEIEYVEAIKEDVRWLGFQWSELRHASDYFETFYLCALKLIHDGKAYVDSLSADEIRTYRGTLTEPGRDSPYRTRSIEENIDLFQRMKNGEFADGAHILRAKIDMASPNMNLRDPTLYRIRKTTHQNTGDAWCIYPMYDYAHCISDAVEGITHSLCTLEFEDHRPLYDWCLEHIDLPNHLELVEPILRTGLRAPVSRPQQIEFSRLNLDYTVMSKRKLMELVNDNLVEGWDDPRMPTLSAVRRRGFTPRAIRNFCERIGISKQNSVIEYSNLEDCVREDLDVHAPRRLVVINPLKIVLTNINDNHQEEITVPNHPQKPEMGTRTVPFSRILWIEQEDFMETPLKGFHRLIPNGEVRLRFVGIIKCENILKNKDGKITELHCTLDPSTRPGLPGAERKVKGTIHWLSCQHAIRAEVRLYDRLFTVPNPDDGSEGKTYRDYLNENSKRIVHAWIEPCLAAAKPESAYQFERLGYFTVDRYDSSAEKLVINRTVTLRDSWAKAQNR